MFYNPLLPYACHIHTALKGFYCLFTERFLLEPNRDVSLQESPLFRIGTTPIFYLTDEQVGVTRFVAGSM